jgi:hypothetical protein
MTPGSHPLHPIASADDPVANDGSDPVDVHTAFSVKQADVFVAGSEQ